MSPGRHPVWPAGRWPPVVRLLVGAAAGWVVVEVWATGGPGWQTAAASGAMAVAALVAPGHDRWAGTGVTSGWAVATAVGLYVGVPETDRIVGVVAVLAVVWLMELTGRARVDGLIVAVLALVLVWTTVEGAAGRAGALIAGLALLGLLVLAPIAARLPRPTRRPLVTAPWQAPALVACQFAYAVGVARLGGVRTTAGTALLVSAIAATLLLAVATVLVGTDRAGSRLARAGTERG